MENAEMRVVDKASPRDSEKFYIHAGKMAVEAMLTGRPLSEFTIEDSEQLIKAAMELPQAVKDKWFQAGIRVTLTKMLQADAQRLVKNAESVSMACAPLARHLAHLMKTDPKFTISARAVQPKIAMRKIVQHDEQGRIKSFLEVEESVVI